MGDDYKNENSGYFGRTVTGEGQFKEDLVLNILTLTVGLKAAQAYHKYFCFWRGFLKKHK